MSAARYAPSEIIHLDQQRYERDIRLQVEVHLGKMLALDVESGEYALGDDSILAFDRLKAKTPNAQIYLVRVGYPTAVHMGCARGRPIDREVSFCAR